MSNVTKEAMKAETKLKNIRKRAEEARASVVAAWAVREADYLASLPSSVADVLLAAGVIQSHPALSVAIQAEVGNE